MRPEEALEAARAAARPADPDVAAASLGEPPERVTADRLMEWAVIDVDVEKLRSTRRLGAPITAAKRALAHVLRQYLRDQESQQTRFNLHVALKLAELEERVERLERVPPTSRP